MNKPNIDKGLMEKINTIVRNGKGGKPCVFEGDIVFADNGEAQTFQLCYVTSDKEYQRLVEDAFFDAQIFYYLLCKEDLIEACNGSCWFTLTDINLN